MCDFDVSVVARIGAASGPGSFPGPVTSFVVDRRDRYWVWFANTGLVFDSDGDFLASVGRPGRGPGEFVFVSQTIALPGDSILVLDQMAMRATVIGPDFSVARLIRLPQMMFWSVALIGWPGAIAINGLVQNPGTIGWPLHIVDMSSENAVVGISFGSSQGEYRLGGEAQLMRILAPLRNRRLVAANIDEYGLQIWTADGNLVTSFNREPVWFPGPVNPYGVGSRTDPPPPRIRALMEDGNGRIWVVAHVPRSDWRAAWADVPSLPKASAAIEVPVSDLPTPGDLYETRIDVLHAQTGRLIAAGTTEHLVYAALPGDRLAAVSKDATGVVILSVRLRTD
jgi:hypothetical protein